MRSFSRRATSARKNGLYFRSFLLSVALLLNAASGAGRIDVSQRPNSLPASWPRPSPIPGARLVASRSSTGALPVTRAHPAGSIFVRTVRRDPHDARGPLETVARAARSRALRPGFNWVLTGKTAPAGRSSGNSTQSGAEAIAVRRNPPEAADVNVLTVARASPWGTTWRRSTGSCGSAFHASRRSARGRGRTPGSETRTSSSRSALRRRAADRETRPGRGAAIRPLAPRRA